MLRVKLFTTMVVALIPISPLAASSTTVSQTLTAGSLVLNSSPSVALSSISLNGGTTAGSLGAVTLNDGRGSGAGWSVTATASNFTHIGAPARVNGSVGGLTVGGVYTGLSSGTYEVTITQGGSVSGAAFTVSGLESQTPTVTNGAPPIGTKGLTATFAAGNYVVGDRWTIAVYVIPVDNLTITPSAVSSNNDLGGVTPGPSHSFISTSEATTIMSASSGNGMGQYSNTPNLSLIVPSGLRSGNYTTIITETAN